MRRGQRKLAGNYIRLLNQAHDGLKRAFELRRYNIAKDLLEQCQEIAIKLGELIESADGSNRSIPLLEDYCELVYQIYEKTGSDCPADSYKTCKKLRKNIVQVENIIKHDTDSRMEVVFLPYKASMWDSLESVWKAAEEDPDCDAYVIPIPYYDKNPDGSFREEHYEGDLYPDYVPITRYDEYDFEMHQPDITFIHNPYDECNYVTSVHPLFYAKELKNYTGQLVYIPYFILDEIDPADEEMVKGIEHFCIAPGVIHADKVIVQSEKMRQIYINVLVKHTGKNKRHWGNKILGLGSPKTDKVLRIKKNDIEVPKEWLELIRKPSGEWKKVILYNTSVGALLAQDEKMIKKMQEVFRIFKAMQKEITLLWRPHPLIQATLEAMRPELWEAYREMMDEYRKEGWGIYDNTPDLSRAIALSDGYYGDPSSLVQLYRNVKMPIMIQNTEIQ
ncbi:MAG: hypothetical protein HFH10_07890 [Dorea sp.]|nr:hypothetical protein [Dorea sp.]